jgi:hypothetical protein
MSARGATRGPRAFPSAQPVAVRRGGIRSTLWPVELCRFNSGCFKCFPWMIGRDRSREQRGGGEGTQTSVLVISLP